MHLLSQENPYKMATTYTEYITKEGDRIDTIAVKAYGDPHKWDPIIRENKGLPIQDVYPAGIRLVILIEVPDAQTTNQTLLPPWKQ
jgi:phage tail protein X